MGAYVTRTVNGKQVKYYKDDGGRLHRSYDDAVNYQQRNSTSSTTNSGLSRQPARSARPTAPSKPEQYTEGWITLPGIGRRWRTSDGKFFDKQPGVIDNILSGLQQSLTAATGSTGTNGNSLSTPARSARPNNQSSSRSSSLPANYAAQESAEFAKAQGWQDFVTGVTRTDPNALTREHGQVAFKDNQRVEWDKSSLSWVPAPADDQRRQGKNGEEYYDAYTKQWKPLPNYQSTPRLAPQTKLGTVLQTIDETINQLRNPLDSFTRTAFQHGLPDAVNEALDRGLIDIPTFTREGFANAVSVKALLGELGRPFRLSPPPDARKAFSDQHNAMAVVSPSGNTASYSRSNPNWDPKLNFAKGPAGEIFAHRVVGQYKADLKPWDGTIQTPSGRVLKQYEAPLTPLNTNRQIATVRDFWDTNWTTEQHLAALNGRYPTFKESAVMLTSKIQEEGGLNRLPMGSTTQWDIAPRVPTPLPASAPANVGISLPIDLNLGNLLPALGLVKPQPSSTANTPSRVQLPQGPMQIIQSQMNLRPSIAKGSIYVVQEGDTLWDIAQKTGKTIEAIVGSNNIKDPSLIMPGQRISF